MNNNTIDSKLLLFIFFRHSKKIVHPEEFERQNRYHFTGLVISAMSNKEKHLNTSLDQVTAMHILRFSRKNICKSPNLIF